MSILNKFKNWLHVSTFVSRAYSEINKIDNNEFFRRKNRETKKLIEEILPLATFLKYFEGPERKIKCIYFSDNRKYDARIKIKGIEVEKGFIESEYYLEVTIAENQKIEHLRREALARYGSVFGGEKIRRVINKKKGINKIESNPSIQDIDYPVKAAIQLSKRAIEKKINENYPKPCLLIVQVTTDRNFSISEWAELAKELQTFKNNNTFQSIFIVNWGTNMTFKL
jgi:hypothetical protein